MVIGLGSGGQAQQKVGHGKMLIVIWLAFWVSLKGTAESKLEKKGDIIYSYGKERFGIF